MPSLGQAPDDSHEHLAPPVDLQERRHQFLSLLQTRAGVGSDVQELLVEKKDLPEKVSGLEKLAVHGFPVPKHRRYIPAGKTPEEKSQIIADFLREVPEKKNVAVRSVHDLESRFSGGAFTSYILGSNGVWGKNSQMSEKIQQAIASIISLARPEDSLQLRRDIRHRDIKNYDPADMGIYLNEAVDSAVQVTVVPLNNGSLSLRFFSGDEYGMCLRTIEVAPDERYEGDVGYLTWTTSVDIKGMIAEIARAQALFERPQEMEIHIGKSGTFHFVQTKDAIPESTSNAIIPDELRGISTYAREDIYGTRSCMSLNVERASKRDEVREMPALIIDEGEWIRDHLKYSRKELGRLGLSDLQDNPDMLDGLTKKYQELMKLAEEMPSYALIIRNMQFQSYANRDDLSEKVRAFGKMRQQLSECASVQLRGESDYYSGLLSASHHYRFGSFGPRQIGITHSRGEVDLPCETGDQLTIMIRDRKVSIYTKKLHEAQEAKAAEARADAAYLEVYGKW